MKTKHDLFFAKIVAITAVGLSGTAGAAPAQAPRESVTPAFREVIVGEGTGRTMTALIVDYPPGGKSLPHRHGLAFVVGYVLSGEIRSQVNNGPVRVYHAGAHWTEQPGVHHKVSENASLTKPARLLAVFVADTRQKSLVQWDKK